MKIKWTKAAENDLQQILWHIAQDSPEAGMNVLNRIKKKTRVLESYPLIGRVGRKAETRELVLAGLPYFIVYRVFSDWISIYRVLHQARKWPFEVGN